MNQPAVYRAYSLHNFRKLPQVSAYLGEQALREMEVVGQVLPFKVNNYVADELIDWTQVPDDPIFRLTFPHRDMLLPHHFDLMAHTLARTSDKATIRKVANQIRMELNPHPAGQMSHNVPQLNGIKLTGLQHKYRETVLFFPAHGQTCHAYCSFCFRWPQFVGMDELKFAMRETELLVAYLKAHPEVTDVLITGGDPMIMKAKRLRAYIEPLLEADLPHLQHIRIGSKALAYWPYRFLTDQDADDVLRLFERVVQAGKHLAFMAHFNHAREMQTEAVRQAISRIRSTGAEIRTQSPLLRHINDEAPVWAEMWREQVRQGCVPYYMFVARDTGAHHYFAVPLSKAHEIYRKAYQQVSGLARTVRGPSMSAHPGKICVLGTAQVGDEQVFVLTFLQGRNPKWVGRPFFARYDEHATWINELQPALGEPSFFFEADDTVLINSAHALN